MRSPRLWIVLLLMSATLLTLRVRGDVDRVPQSRPLDQLPAAIDGRRAVDVPINDEVLQVLGKGVFLDRMYLSGPQDAANAAETPPIGLFIGYFPTQRTGQAIHSPQNCLPGAGWVFESSGVMELTDPTGKKYTVGDYLISDGKSSQEVLYWYRVHGKSVANDYKAKFYTLLDSIRYDRTDAALVRIITPVVAGEDRVAAQRRAAGFAEQVVPLLPAYIPD